MKVELKIENKTLKIRELENKKILAKSEEELELKNNKLEEVFNQYKTNGELLARKIYQQKDIIKEKQELIESQRKKIATLEEFQAVGKQVAKEPVVEELIEKIDQELETTDVTNPMDALELKTKTRPLKKSLILPVWREKIYSR